VLLDVEPRGAAGASRPVGDARGRARYSPTRSSARPRDWSWSPTSTPGPVRR
jgi:hypothetical protein